MLDAPAVRTPMDPRAPVPPAIDDALAMARALADRLEGPGIASRPSDHRIRLARAHALALVDLLGDLVLQDGD